MQSVRDFLEMGAEMVSPGKRKWNHKSGAREPEARKHAPGHRTNLFDDDDGNRKPKPRRLTAGAKRKPRGRGNPLDNTRLVRKIQVPATKVPPLLKTNTLPASGPLAQARRLQGDAPPRSRAVESRHSDSLVTATGSRTHHDQTRSSISISSIQNKKKKNSSSSNNTDDDTIIRNRDSNKNNNNNSNSSSIENVTQKRRESLINLCVSDSDTGHEEPLPRARSSTRPQPGKSESSKYWQGNKEPSSSSDDSMDSKRKQKRKRGVEKPQIPSVSYDKVPLDVPLDVDDQPVSNTGTICRLSDDENPHRSPVSPALPHPGAPRQASKKPKRKRGSGGLSPLRFRTVDTLEEKYGASSSHHYDADTDDRPPPTSSLPADLQAVVLGTPPPRHPGAPPPRHPYEAQAIQKTAWISRHASKKTPSKIFLDDDDDDPLDDSDEYGSGRHRRPRASPPTADGSDVLRNFVDHVEDLEIPTALPRSEPTGGGSLFSLSKANNQPAKSEEKRSTKTASSSPSRRTGNRAAQKRKPVNIRPGCTFRGNTKSPKPPPAHREASEREFEWRPNEEEDDLYYSRAKSRRRSPRNNRSTLRRHQEPEILEIEDSDSETEQVQQADERILDFPLSRISIGKKILCHECKGFFNPTNHELRLEWRKKSSGGIPGEMTLCLKDGTMEHMAFYTADWKEDDDPTRDTTEELDDAALARELGSFCAMRAKPTNENRLIHYKTSYRPKGDNEACRYVVVEFRNPSDVIDFREHCSLSLGSSGTEIVELDTDSCPPYSRSLLRHLRTKWNDQNQDTFVRGLAADHLLLVYPFDGDEERIEKAAEGLTEASNKVAVVGDDTSDSSSSSDDDDANEEEAAGRTRYPVVQRIPNSDRPKDPGPTAVVKKKRAHYVTLRVDDYTRLDPGEWLNDSLVDFWMQWISREDASLTSKFHFFTSHFFTTLQSSGPSAVASWTKRKKINIFEKKLIFIPINKDLHWSLCVLVNPGIVVTNAQRNKKSDPLSCMIFMDSLRMHNKGKISSLIREWLNNEWKEINQRMHGRAVDDNPFIVQTFRMFSPRVPYQNNTWDCGVFVCRYAYAVFELRNRNFTCEDAGLHCEEDDNQAKKPLVSLISDSAEFNFNMEDIARFRVEFKTLIERLSKVYDEFKRAEKEQERQRRANSIAAGEDDNAENDEPIMELEAKASSGQEQGEHMDSRSGLVANEKGIEKENIRNSASIVYDVDEATKFEESSMPENSEARPQAAEALLV